MESIHIVILYGLFAALVLFLFWDLIVGVLIFAIESLELVALSISDFVRDRRSIVRALNFAAGVLLAILFLAFLVVFAFAVLVALLAAVCLAPTIALLFYGYELCRWLCYLVTDDPTMVVGVLAMALLATGFYFALPFDETSLPPPDQQEAGSCSWCGPLSSGPRDVHYDEEYSECVHDDTGDAVSQWIPDQPYFIDQEGAGTVTIACPRGCSMIEAMTNNPSSEPNRIYVENVNRGTIYNITFHPEDQGGQVYVSR